MVKVIGILAISMSQAITATTKFKYPWMFGRRFDLFFYFAPIAFGIACYALSQSILADSSTLWLVLAVNAFGAGPFHQGPTWFAYLDKKNRSHYASTDRLKLIFYLGPVLVMAVTVLGWVYFRGIIYAITMAWAVQHIVQQNIGILLLYHNHGRGEALVEKKLESWSQWAPAIFFSTFFIHRILFQNADNLIFTGITAVTGVWALTIVARYILTLIKKSNEGEYINVPALLFWMVSVLSLAPFAFLGKSFDDAFVIPVTIHWFQYIGLNYMLVRYKYSSEEEGENRANLPNDNPMMLFFLMGALLLGMGLGLNLLKNSGLLESEILVSIIGGIVIGLANTHYFLDAFMWRFREDYQRNTILPFLIKPRKAQ